MNLSLSQIEKRFNGHLVLDGISLALMETRALVLIGPVLFDILCFHIFMAPSSIGPGLLATLLWFLVFYSVRSNFAGIFAQKA